MALLGNNDMSPGDSIVKGLGAVARHFGKSLRTAQRWAKEPDFPKLSGGRYDLLQVQAWLDARDGKPAARRQQAGDQQQPFLSEGPRGKEKEDARLKKITADIKELELKQLQGELIPLAQVEGLLAPRAMAYRQGIQAMQTLAPEIGLRYGLPPEAVRSIAEMIASRGRELLANVLRPLILNSGQPLQWQAESPELTQGGA